MTTAHLQVGAVRFHGAARGSKPAGLTVILGPNGAGKTTLLRTLAS
jgi:ABC-type cobalamin/Fe3+-siderophores transport system ATPase subunit